MKIYRILQDKDDPALRWHEGQRRRPHVITDESSPSRCCFNLILNSILFKKKLIFSILNSIHVLGKFMRGYFSKVESLVKGMVEALLLQRIR